ncbi:DUF4192 domain-containing protein [Nocardioides sp. Bht2]|uniref:DUF4192 domain-containing protein n=1 Tax=Nocardioides sp. Bht2 TaxID=3392297 RepID=UPI0039B6B590
MTTHPPRRLRTPDDIAAHVASVMGFHPDDSLVLLTFGSSSGFQARVALQDSDAMRADAVHQLLTAARSTRTDAVLPVLYTPDPERARQMLLAVVRGFSAAGIQVLPGLRIADGLSFELTLHHAGTVGHRLELETHPFLAAMSAAGQSPHPSRAALVATLDADREARREVLVALALRGDAPPDPEAANLMLRRHLRCATQANVAESVELYLVLADARGRQLVRSLLSRPAAAEHLAFWPRLVRSAPAGLIAEPLAVLGLAAWLGGNGALGWCALDRLAECAPRHPVRAFLATRLAEAIEPSARSLDALTEWGAP